MTVNRGTDRAPARAPGGPPAIVELTAITALAPARPARFRARLARMYGIIGNAAGHAAPARGRMHCVIIAAEQPGHSDASSFV